MQASGMKDTKTLTRVQIGLNLILGSLGPKQVDILANVKDETENAYKILLNHIPRIRIPVGMRIRSG